MSTFALLIVLISTIVVPVVFADRGMRTTVSAFCAIACGYAFLLRFIIPRLPS